MRSILRGNEHCLYFSTIFLLSLIKNRQTTFLILKTYNRIYYVLIEENYVLLSFFFPRNIYIYRYLFEISYNSKKNLIQKFHRKLRSTRHERSVRNDSTICLYIRSSPSSNEVERKRPNFTDFAKSDTFTASDQFVRKSKIRNASRSFARFSNSTRFSNSERAICTAWGSSN